MSANLVTAVRGRPWVRNVNEVSMIELRFFAELTVRGRQLVFISPALFAELKRAERTVRFALPSLINTG